MICYQENYGADYDNNRGQLVWMCELEPSDTPEVIRQLQEQLAGWDDGCELPKVAYVEFVNPYDESIIEFEVDPRDYLCE